MHHVASKYRFVLLSLVALSSPASCREETPAPASGADTQTGSGAHPVTTEGDGMATRGSGVESASACLPTSGEIGGWVVRQPPRVLLAGDLSSALLPSEAERLAYFRVLSVVTAAYAPFGNDRDASVAQVLIVVMETPFDALAFLTCRADDGERLDFGAGGEARLVRADGYHLHAWRGTHYLHVSTRSPDAAVRESLKQFSARVYGCLSAKEAPALAGVVPGGDPGPDRVWLARDIRALPATAQELFAFSNVRRVCEVLGLDDTTQVCVARYVEPSARGPNVVWVVRYETPKGAYDAHARYTRYLNRGEDRETLSTSLLPPHGPFLIGTWTAEEEAIQYVLPRITRHLPIQDTVGGT